MAVMFKCAVSSVPGCYDYFEAAIFNMYFHSPYSCELSEQQIMELQSIHNRGTQADDELSTTSPADVESTAMIPTDQYREEDNVYTTLGAGPADTYQLVTGTPHNGSQAANIPCGYGCIQEEEQRGGLESNGAGWVVSSRIPVVVLLMLRSGSLSWMLVS